MKRFLGFVPTKLELITGIILALLVVALAVYTGLAWLDVAVR